MASKIKIVLAEDDKFISRAYGDGFTRAGFEVSIASDGNEAIKLVKANKPDLLLLDLIMPGKDGFETLTEVMADPTMKNTKVVVMSNLGQESDIERCKKLGAVEYLVKSNVSMKEVIDIVNKLIS